MMEKQITIERSAHRHEWGLAIRDKLGITLSLALLNAREVAKIIEGINAAAEQGAGWPRYVKATSPAAGPETAQLGMSLV